MLNLILLGLLVFFAILAIELENITYSIISLGFFGTILGIIFYQLNAPYASVFQILIYGGAITIFLFSISNMYEKKLKEDSLKNKAIVFILILVLICLFYYFGFISQYSFKGRVISKLKKGISTYIWETRVTDTILQAFIIFSTIVGVLLIWQR